MRKNPVFQSLVVFFVSISMLGGGQVAAQNGDNNSSRQYIENPSVSIVFCDNGVTREGAIEDFEQLMVAVGVERPSPEDSGGNSGWFLDWSEVAEGISAGPCSDSGNGNSDDGSESPYDPNQIVEACAFYLGLELDWNPTLSTLLSEDHGLAIVDGNGDISLTEQGLAQMYLGHCTGAMATPTPMQLLESPEATIILCDNGATWTGPWYEYGFEDGVFVNRLHHSLPGALFSGPTLNWNKAPEGVTQGPCVDDSGDNGNGDIDTPITVQVILPGGESVEGAEFGLYAPSASTLPPGAFHTGVVGANNTLTLPELIPGTYRIVIAPEDGDLIEFNITLDEDDTALVVDLTEDDADSNGDGGSKDSDKAPSNGKNDGADKVTGLPETGTGAASTSGALWLATAASMVMTVGAMLIRQKRV